MAEGTSMRVLIAVDSFKGSFSSLEVAEWLRAGVCRVYPEAVIDAVPIADGGEGTVSALRTALGGRTMHCLVHGPLVQVVEAQYLMADNGTAFMEMAEAAGLCLVEPSHRDPSLASTFGVGQMMLDAIDHGATRIILGLGGSATNDGGAGMARALGARFLKADGTDIEPSGFGLSALDHVDVSGMDKRLHAIPIVAACDVDNPLYGPSGASMVFGPQKGGTPETLQMLDENLAHLAHVIHRDLGVDIGTVAGGGAAGGLCAGLVAFCDANVERGIDVVMDAMGIDERIARADIVLTGEGRMDAQTCRGKVPVGVAKRAKLQGKPVFGIAGYLGEGHEHVYAYGVDAAFSAIVAPMSLEEAITASGPNLSDATERLFRTIKAIWK